MYLPLSFVLPVLFSLSLAAPATTAAASAPAPTADADGKYWIRSPKLQLGFVPYGASLSNLLLTDAHGRLLDVVTGFDNAAAYTLDKAHAHFGGVPGRYANRIRNSTFSIDGKAYHVLPNDHPTAQNPEGVDTLHGGPQGWDWRNFTVVAHTESAITFELIDPDGEQGFPGEVRSLVTYAVEDDRWEIVMSAVATTKDTPIMLSSHVYWNLDGWANDETDLALDHVLHMPYAGSRIDVDGILIPTGNLLANERGGVNDFWSEPRRIGFAFKEAKLEGNCGTGCVGYDNCYITHREALTPYDWRDTLPVATLSSPWSGIKLEVWTDQDAFQLYSCNFQDGTTPLKKTQQQGKNGTGMSTTRKPATTIQKYGCLVLEVQDWIDGINHPEWGRLDKQVFGPGRGNNPYVLKASYRFTVDKK